MDALHLSARGEFIFTMNKSLESIEHFSAIYLSRYQMVPPMKTIIDLVYRFDYCIGNDFKKRFKVIKHSMEKH